ncbi:ExbD/TolR family protein [Hydrogenophaga sp.]|uniref:ExbD/TolR family protein n=1 Tax=Hydrogenophaga sp. TaxID=1904254 RepID=UPI003F6EF269
MSFGGLEKPVGHQPMSDINVTPLVDVMLVLLVIFIIAAPFMASRLALDLPQAETPSLAQAGNEAIVSVEVDARGQIHWDGQPVSQDTLRERLQEAARRDPSTELQLRADASVPYGQVVQLIGLAQSAGLSRIGFVADAPPAPAR